MAASNTSFDSLVIGSGLAGLVAACCLWERGRRNIAVVASGLGGTPYVAAFNSVLPDSPHGDTPELYCSDMYKAGYQIGNRELIDSLGQLTFECVQLLERWGVAFTRLDSGEYRLRMVSGSSCPRSLCRTDMLVGLHIAQALRKGLREKGVVFFDNTACCALAVKDGAIQGITCCSVDGGEPFFLAAPTVLAAWGGVGNLYRRSTYPADIDGRTLAMAYEAGVSLIDLEFVEFEPMVSLEPPAAVGEPCPTAMLGEGAHLLNNRGERFLLKIRPEGEAGAPKSLINNAIREELKAGRGSPLGGVYVDLRHIDEKVLRSYPWFYDREMDAGLDVKKSLLQVGPMAHSHSGGMEIDSACMTNISGLYAAGEAAGGMHGACRMAGNAATQAAVSGLAAAKSMAQQPAGKIAPMRARDIAVDMAVREKLSPRIRETVTRFIEKERTRAGLTEAIAVLDAIGKEAAGDDFTRQLALSAVLLASAALKREESRGTHYRDDFRDTDANWQCSIRIRNDRGAMLLETVGRGAYRPPAEPEENA